MKIPTHIVRRLIAGSVFCLVLVLSMDMKAQSLSFNQVKLITSLNGVQTNDTVPAGKVWKIENAVVTSSTSYVLMYLGGTAYFLNFQSSNYNDHLPYWLPAGTVVGFSASGSGINAKVSIIEFNVTP